MELILGIFLIILSLVSWIAWSIILLAVFFLAMFIPWGLWEGVMYFTFNNVMNFVSKIPTFIGWFIGYVFALPFCIPGIVIAFWSYVQVLFMSILVLNGDPNSTFAQNYLTYVSEWEFSSPGCMVVARFFYNHMQWLWGCGSVCKSFYPWQNGVWADVSIDLPIPVTCIKIFLLGIPYTLMFIIPLLPLVWSIFRPIIAANSHLPSVLDNGDGRD